MAALTTEQFQEAQPSSLNLFTLPPTQTAIEKVYFQEVRPISQLTGNNTPIEFIISGQNGMEYIDMKRSKIYVKAKIQHSDGSKYLSTEFVGPSNLLLHSMFSQCDVTLQGKSITSTTSHYPYKAMIQTLLKYGNQAKMSQLTSQLWLKDTSGHMDDNDVENGSNTALYERAQFFNGGKSVDMEGPILHDLFSLDRYLLNQVAVSVKFYRSKPEFYLMTSETSPDYEIFIEDICLKVCKVQVNPAVIYGQAEVLKQTNAKYPYTRTEIKQISIPTGQISCAFDNLFQGLKPNRVVIAFVKSEAAAGSYTLNGYNFHHFDLSQIGLFVDSIPVSGNVMKLSYDNILIPLGNIPNIYLL
ncbi:hypothetical protein KUTeg_014632 [Tegillarca granosa]|uniref:Uncharacterized protein n=1 Tax=Tegillarca granosa TaxID=220873 RepID=A0ABQ9ERK4_TEGGR|nr:hypothetical protein KUTeg_014632 [Tegillarca granosa]